MLADSKAHGKALKKRDAFFKECIMFPDPLGLAHFHKTPNPVLSLLQIELRPVSKDVYRMTSNQMLES